LLGAAILALSQAGANKMSDNLKALISTAAIVLTVALLVAGLGYAAAQTWPPEYPACSYGNSFKGC
jgi:hypothetical protein